MDHCLYLLLCKFSYDNVLLVILVFMCVCFF